MKKLTLKDVFRAAFSELGQETIKQYSYSYRVFARYVYINEKTISRPDTFKCFDWLLNQDRGQVYLILKTYREFLLKIKKYKHRSINKEIFSINTLLNNAYNIGFIDWAPRKLKPLPIPEKQLKNMQGPPPDIFDKIMAQAEAQPGLWNKRDPAILAMMYYMGLRTIEITRIPFTGINLKEKTVTFIGKGRSSEGTYSIPEPCIPYLKNYLRFRDQRKSPLFRTIDPRSKRFLPHGISRRVIYDTVSRLSEKAGHKINPHALRHSNVNLVISEIAKKGLGIDYLQAWTRHKDIKELDFYFDHPDVKQKAVSSMISKDIGKQKDIEPVPTEDDKFAMILKELAELKAKMP